MSISLCTQAARNSYKKKNFVILVCWILLHINLSGRMVVVSGYHKGNQIQLVSCQVFTNIL